jgi:hypothetical protein
MGCEATCHLMRPLSAAVRPYARDLGELRPPADPNYPRSRGKPEMRLRESRKRRKTPCGRCHRPTSRNAVHRVERGPTCRPDCPRCGLVGPLSHGESHTAAAAGRHFTRSSRRFLRGAAAGRHFTRSSRRFLRGAAAGRHFTRSSRRFLRGAAAGRHSTGPSRRLLRPACGNANYSPVADVSPRTPRRRRPGSLSVVGRQRALSRRSAGPCSPRNAASCGLAWGLAPGQPRVAAQE